MMLLHAFRRLIQLGFRRVSPERLGGKRSHRWVAGALALGSLAALTLGSFAALTVAPALAQGIKKPNALKEAIEESSLVQLLVTVDKAKTVGCDHEFTEVLVANPAIADVIALSNKQVYVLGKKAGITSISLVGVNKRVIGLVNVEVAHDLEGLTRRLQKFVPGSDLTVTSVNGKVLLTGTVPDTPSLSRAMAIAEQVAPGAVTNAMSVRGSQQVLLEVRFIEATSDSSRDVAFAWDIVGKKGTNQLVTGLGGLISNSTPFGVAIARVLDNGTTADVLIQALEQRGVARRLAEPNLVALSGDTASFLAGGEFPFPVQADNNKITYEFKKFGVGLSFTPTVLGEGLINLKVEPEVSEIDPSSSVVVAGASVPGLMVRRSRTTLELRDGQSFAMAGLLYTNHYKNQNQLPWIGDVPVLGTLFRSAGFQRKETDLVIIVTPRLVRPTRPGQELKTPLDKRLPSNDVEFFLGGQQEVVATKPEPDRGHLLEFGLGDRKHKGSNL